MNFSIKKQFFIFTCLVCLFSNSIFAAKEKTINSLTGANIIALPIGSINPYSLVAEDQKLSFMNSNPNWMCRFDNKESRVSVVLRFDDSKRNFDNSDWNLNVTYEIKLFRTGTVPFATFPAETAAINFKKASSTNYTDIFLKTYEGALRAEVKILTVSWTPFGGPSLAAPPVKYANDIYFDLIQETERYYNFSFNGINCTPASLIAPFVSSPITPLTLNQTVFVRRANCGYLVELY